jgi:hypothetical protein
MKHMRLGAAGTQTWEDVGILSATTLGVATQMQFYRVMRVPLTNALDYDGDGLGDDYELTHEYVSPYDSDSDRDGATDGEEVNVWKTDPSSPYSGRSEVYYGFDTNLEGWVSENWEGYGHPVMVWSNASGVTNPCMSPGAMWVGAPSGTGYAKTYVKDTTLFDNQDVKLKPLATFWVFVPSGAPLPVGEALKVKFYVRSSSDGWSWRDATAAIRPQPGEWSEIVLSNINEHVLNDADEWGVEVVWPDRDIWDGGIFIDSVHHMPYQPPTNLAPDFVSHTGTTSVGKYKKFEATLELTNVFGLNPYDPRDVNLEATFVSPSGAVWDIWGFYMEETNDAFGAGDWKVRFAPDTIGTWEYSFRVSNKNGTNYSTTGTFTCVASDQHGWLRVSDDDPHYLEHDDDEPFMGIGYCHPWDGDDEGIFANCAEHGINMLHWWMAPWDTLLTIDRANPWETWYESSSFYTYEQTRAAEMDRIMEYAEQYGVKFVFTIWPHDAIRDFNHHKWRINGSWAKAFDTKFSEPEWYINAFSHIDDPPKNQKFFWEDTYKRWQDNLYRYIIARWGYSESIGTWALASEMFGTFANSLNCINYQGDEWVTNKNAMFGENPYYNMNWDQCDGKDYTIPWLTYIHNYFATNDPFGHPTTASYGTDEYWADGFPVIDITQIHTYADLYSWITPPVTVAKYHHYLNEKYDKPSFMGEIGTVDWKHYEPDYQRVTTWPAIAAGAAITPMMWTTPAFSWFGDPKMGPFTRQMADELEVFADFAEDIDWHKMGFTPADVHTAAENEPPVTVIEDFESGINGWSKHGAGAASIEISTNHVTEGDHCLRVDIDIPTWDEMASPEPGIEKYGFSYDWTNYWPNGTLKMDIYVPEFYHPEKHPDGFLLGVNKDPRSIVEVHTDGSSGWKWWSTTNEYAEEGGWKKLTVGMTYNLELNLDEIASEDDAANVAGIKFKFGNAGILKGPIYIDNITAGLYAFHTWGLISRNAQFAFAWIQDRRWEDGLVASNAAFTMNGLENGAYNLEWWSTRDGIVGSENANVTTGTLAVTVPPFNKDMAVKIRRIGAGGSTVHDVAVGHVQRFEEMVQSATQTVDVLLFNRGTASETFDVVLTDTTDAAVIGTNSVTVRPGSNVVSTFTWNNTNATMGITHTLTAVAESVPLEADTSDNTLSADSRLYASTPPWDSCDALRRWKEDRHDTDARALTVQTNMAYVTEEEHSFRFYHRSPDKGQAYFGFDQVYEDWSNRTAFVYDMYVAESSTNAQLLMRAGAGWDWYYSKNVGVSSGWNTNITFYFHSNEWTHAVWNDGTESWDYDYNVPAGGLEEMQQIFIKVSGYTNAGIVYVDNMRVPGE